MHFIALQGTYSSLSLGFFLNGVSVNTVCFDALRASSNLVPLLEDFLRTNKTSLEQLAFIAVDKGPGAFTSLRATIASVNGIAYATKIPLIGINSLEGLQADTLNTAASTRYVAAILNAYNNDVYFRIFDRQNNHLIEESCQKIDLVLQKLIALKAPILCMGNGVTLHQAVLQSSLRDCLLMLPNNPAVPSVDAIALLAYGYWKTDSKQHAVESIEPYYLKTQLFAIKQ